MEAINKIGSAFYGPVLATCTAGIQLPRVTATGIKQGIATGVLLNLVLWLAAPQVNWMWWNAIGFLVAIIVTVMNADRQQPSTGIPSAAAYLREQRENVRPLPLLLICWFVLIILAAAILPVWLGP